MWWAKPPSPRHCVGLRARTCMLPQGKERERAYFLRPHVHRFLALSMGVVMGRFVPLPFIAFFLGRTSTPEKEEEEEAKEEEEEVLASSEDAEPSLPLESGSASDPDSGELVSSSGFHSQSEQPSEASK